MAILVVGGCGYIGSHIVHKLLALHEEVVVFDNLSTGFLSSIPYDVYNYGDLKKPNTIDSIFEKYKIDTVMHLAANSLIEESIKDPMKYCNNNIVGTINLINSMIKYNVKKIIFSSSATVYGEPITIPITEEHPTNPKNTYGLANLTIENILKFAQTKGLSSIILRYFNVSGSNYLKGTGERHEPETHLIPIVIKNILNNKPIHIFGNDYNTPDGTCIRDYIHIMDSVDAHILAYKDLQINPNQYTIYNLGSRNGYSVNDIINLAEEITGKSIEKIYDDRREGDAEKLIASSNKIEEALNWKRLYNIRDIISSTYNFEKQLKNIK